MNFILTYKGLLKSRNKAKVEHKHEIRRVFHYQLKRLWNTKPLKEHKFLFQDDGYNRRTGPPKPQTQLIIPEYPDIRRELNGKRFASIVHPALELTAELQIKLFHPSEISEDDKQNVTADLDNRMKTLVDALRRPRDEQEYKEEFKQDDEEGIFFCVLDDDSLITSIQVESAMYLGDIAPKEVFLMIDVLLSTKHSLPATFKARSPFY